MDKGKKHKTMHRNLTQKALGAMNKDQQENRNKEESKNQLSQSFSTNVFGGRGTEKVTTSSLMNKSMIIQTSSNKNSYGRERISSFQAPKKLLVKPVKMNMSMIAAGG